MTQDTTRPRLIPTGNCWCGCGKETSIGAYFSQGHDKIAEAALMAAEYMGSVPQLLHTHGYGPGRPVIREAVSQGRWEKCPYCWYSGTELAVRNHMDHYHPVDGLTQAHVHAELDGLKARGKNGMASRREVQLLARA
jgi:hypothetical protein